MARSSILNGSSADGTEQRLRYGLGEFKPYRWRGIPEWNPAKTLRGHRSVTRRSRACAKCGAQPGESCLSRAGQPIKSVHTQR